MVKVGDRLVVQDCPFPAYVERIEEDPSTASTVLHLDWKEYGKSRVYLHDEGKTWRLHMNVN
jgi:hypothetical protein